MIGDGSRTHAILNTIDQNSENVKSHVEKEKSIVGQINHQIEPISFFIPMDTVSEANGLLSKTRFYKNGKPKPEHWTEKSARHKLQKKLVYLTLNPHRDKLTLPCKVTLIRCSSRFLDEEDNLRVALKWVKDSVAEVLTQNFIPGRADEDKRIKWEYDQEKSKEKGVKLIFES